MNMLAYRSCLVAMLAALVSLAGCGDEKTQRRARSSKTDDEKTAKTDGEGSGKPVATEGWGSLKGRFVVEGTVPSLPELTITQNQPYCNPFKAAGELRNEAIVVNSKNELKNVVVYLSKKPDRIHDDYKQDESAEVVLNNHKCRFEPHIVPVRTTQKLRIKNSDPMGHNTKIDSFTQQSNDSLPEGSAGIIKELKQQERFPIPCVCNVHPWMKGHLVVLSHPYMAVSGDDGSFEIKNLPAGDWEFQLWHEGPGLLEIGDWKAGRKKLTIEAGKPTDLHEIKVPADKLKAA